MKIKNIIIIIFSLLALSLSSCKTSDVISEEKFGVNSNKVTTITKGEDAHLGWKFKNSQYVKVSKFNFKFGSLDSIVVSPDSTTDYTITAFSENDSASFQWKVIVNPSLKDSPETGYDPNYKEGKPAEKYISKYDDKIGNLIPAVIKFMGYKITQPSEDSDYKIKVQMGSQDGHVLFYNQTLLKEENWSIFQVCNSNTSGLPIKTIENVSNPDPAMYNIMLDHSAINIDNFDIIRKLKNFISSTNPQDLFSLTIFNQNEILSTDFIENTKLLNILNTSNLPEVDGTSSIYKYLFKNIKKTAVFNREWKNKYIVLITSGYDNSSMIYSEKDIIDAAKQYRIPIYVIATGNATSTYSLKSLSNSTGGRLYQMQRDELQEIESALKEIYFANKNHLLISIPKLDIDEFDCKQSSSVIGYEFANNRLKDDFVTPNSQTFDSISYQAIALFEKNSTEVGDNYFESIKSFAKVLKDNPKQQIELIGNSWYEGDRNYDFKLAQVRAEKVKERLIDFGAKPEQIVSKSLGSHKPIYYSDEEEWQKLYNRRVEVKWVGSSKNPVEIVIGQFWSEDEAEKKVNEWRNRGYTKIYYERFILETNPIYRIKLWGFSSKTEALNESKKLNNNFKLATTIE